MLHLAEGQTAEACQALNKSNAHQEAGVKWIGKYFHLLAVKSVGFPV
jgi:hypothetical protein